MELCLPGAGREAVDKGGRRGEWKNEKGIQTEKLIYKYLIWIKGNQSCSTNNLLGMQYSNWPNHFNSEEWNAGEWRRGFFFLRYLGYPRI